MDLRAVTAGERVVAQLHTLRHHRISVPGVPPTEVIAVQRSGMAGNVGRAPRYGALATALLATATLAGTAASSQGSSATSRAAGSAKAEQVTLTLGTSYGGVTAQDFPVVVDVNGRRTRVARAIIAIRLSCASGGFMVVSDGYTRLSIRRGKFSASFGPATQRLPDGTTVDLEGSISGTFNSRRTKVSGTWAYKGTEHDATGAVTDTCDSGNVSWSAKQ